MPMDRDGFIAHLPAALRTDLVLRELRPEAGRAASTGRLQLKQLGIESTAALAPSDSGLSSVDFQLELRGTYREFHEYLGRVLQRFDELAVVSLELRRSADRAANVETLDIRLRLRLFAKPGGAAASAVAPR